MTIQEASAVAVGMFGEGAVAEVIHTLSHNAYCVINFDGMALWCGHTFDICFQELSRIECRITA